MPFDLRKVLEEHKGRNFTLHTTCVDPQLPSLLRTSSAARTWLRQLLAELVSVTGLAVARLEVPRAVSLPVAGVSETVEGPLLRRHPSVPFEAARMSRSRTAFDGSGARDEPGCSPRPAGAALEGSARWFAAASLARARRMTRIRRSHGGDPASTAHGTSAAP